MTRQVKRTDLVEELDEACEEHLGIDDDLFSQMLEGIFAQPEGDDDAEDDDTVIVADDEKPVFPAFVSAAFQRLDALRYRENPHQQAAIYAELSRRMSILFHRARAFQSGMMSRKIRVLVMVPAKAASLTRCS